MGRSSTVNSIIIVILALYPSLSQAIVCKNDSVTTLSLAGCYCFASDAIIQSEVEEFECRKVSAKKMSEGDLHLKDVIERLFNLTALVSALGPAANSSQRCISPSQGNFTVLDKNSLVSASESEVPEPVDFDKNSKECRDWIDAHAVCCGAEGHEVAQLLVDHTTYISDQHFVTQMSTAIETFLNYSKIEHGKKFVLIIDNRKNGDEKTSSEWLAGRFLPKLLEKIPRDNIDVITESNLSSYFSLNAHSEVDIIRMDDASYSGKQMASYTKDLKSYLGKERRFHVILPYSTEMGINRIRDASAEQMKYVNMYSVDRIETLRSLGDSTIRETIDNTYSDYLDLEDHTLTFFQHKVPDYLSAISEYFQDGSIRCLDTPRLPNYCEKAFYDCIPKIHTPYKKARFVSEKKKCTQILSDKNSDPERRAKCEYFFKARNAIAECKLHPQKCAR